MNNSKNILKSKTIIFNILVGLVAIATAFGFVDFVPDTDVDQIASTIISVINLINLILRRFTNQPVHILPSSLTDRATRGRM